MLQVARKVGKEVIIGNDAVVTVVNIDFDNREVKLGFDTVGKVSRVDNPATIIQAARIRASTGKGASKRGPIERLPVYVAASVAEGSPQVKASLTSSKASYPGASLYTVDDTTGINPAAHQFVVARFSCRQHADLVTKAMELSQWKKLDSMEHEDASVYVLFIYADRQEAKVSKDVRYEDFI